jgi:hypothetical protein
MLSDLKKTIRYLLGHIRRTDHKLNKIEKQLEIAHFNSQVHFDLNLINQLFSSEEYIPFTRWAISPSTISHVLNDILFNSRRNIIEFGSGSSTFYIAKLIKRLNLNINFISIESDEGWKLKCEKLLNEYDLNNSVKIILAPVKKISNVYSINDNSLWYDTDILKKCLNYNEPFDLVLIDGPWGGLCPYSRFPAIPFLKSNLDDNSTIFLDDTYRSDENKIANLWSKDLNWNLKHVNKYSIIKKNIELKLESIPLNKWKEN